MRAPVRLAFVLALAAARGAAEPAATAPEAPPLPGTRSLYALDVPFLHFAPLELRAPRPGEVLVSASLAYANTFAQTWHAGAIQDEEETRGRAFTRAQAEELHRRHPGDVIGFVDADLTRLAAVATVGLSRRLAVSVEVPWVSWDALGLDGAIEGFHDALGFPHYQRDHFPRGRFQVVRQRPGGALEFDDGSPRAGLGDVTASLAYRTTISPRTRLLAELAVKAPTGSADDYRGSGSWDAGLAAALRHEVSRRLGVRVEAAVVVPGRFRGDVPVTIPVRAFSRLLVGADLRVGARTSVGAAAVCEESPFRGDPVGDGARASYEVLVGITHVFTPWLEASLELGENVPRTGDAPDVSAALSFTIR